MSSSKLLQELWAEKQMIDSHPENSFLQEKEWDSVASAILSVSGEETNLTDEDMEAVNWAKKRFGG